MILQYFKKNELDKALYFHTVCVSANKKSRDKQQRPHDQQQQGQALEKMFASHVDYFVVQMITKMVLSREPI